MGLSELNIRVKYTMLILHDILLVVLKFVVKNHQQCSTKTDLEIGLSEIVSGMFVKFKGTKLFKEKHYKLYFCDLDKATGEDVPKPKIDFKSMDISSLVMLILSPFIRKDSYENFKCCINNCKHDKCSCTEESRHETCGYGKDETKHKKSMKNNVLEENCIIFSIKQFCLVVRNFRNSFSHDNEELYKLLETGKKGELAEFPSKNWEEVWTYVNKITCQCMKVIMDKGIKDKDILLSEDVFKDFEMNLRCANRMEVICMLPVIESRLEDYERIVHQKKEIGEEMKGLTKEMKDLTDKFNIKKEGRKFSVIF